MNKIENWIAFKIKTGYYLELLTPETMELLRSTKSYITKYKNGENVPSWSSISLCNISNNDYQQDPRVWYPFISNKSFVQL